MKLTGIYQIQSKNKPKRLYIGSAINIEERWRLHLINLKQKKHHSIKLQNHFNKYGESDLQFSILLGCEKENLIKIEQYFIDSYNPWFNIHKNAKNALGIKRSEKTKQKMRKAKLGRNHSIETKKKISEALKGKHHSEETKRKIGKANSEANKGIKFSEETRRKLSEAKKGLIPWNKGIKTGKLSEETKRKMSESHKNREGYCLGKKL